MKKGKVLVTGGAGFVGREVIKQLQEIGYYVYVVDDFSNSAPLDSSASLKVVNMDLTKPDGLSKVFSQVNYCIHLAARVGGVKYMVSNQAEILRDNILMDANVIPLVCQYKVKIVYASTVIVYDQSDNLPFTENEQIISPKSNYAFSKLIGEKICQSYAKDNNLRFTIARICNAYGINPNKIEEKKLHVIPDLIRKILLDKTLKLIGGGKQIRTFVHVDDLAKALILMMESKSADGEIFNVATSDRYQILELAEMIWQQLKEKPFSFEVSEQSGEDFIDSTADSSKIRMKLGWEAEQKLKNRLPEIVEWYKGEYGS